MFEFFAEIDKEIYFTIFGTICATFGGVIGAHLLATKNKNRENAITEIRALNTSIMLSHEIANLCLSLKKQHLKHLFEEYLEERNHFQKFHEGFLNNEKQKFIYPNIKLLNLDKIPLPSSQLRHYIYEGFSAPGKIQSLCGTIVRTIELLNLNIEKRNEKIKLFQQQFSDTDHSDQNIQILFCCLYFGLPFSDNKSDTSYFDIMEAIYQYNDDCIKFSESLCEELWKHGKKLRTDNKMPRIFKSDFKDAYEEGLMPPPEKYDRYMSMYKTLD